MIPHLAKINSDFVNASYLRRPLHVAGIGVQQTRYPALPEVVEQWRVFLEQFRHPLDFHKGFWLQGVD